MGLFQFRYMPFGLTGAPSSSQRLMNQLLRNLPFVTIYIDDKLVHSANVYEHAQHLRQVFDHLKEANLSLRGSKCHIAMSKVSHVFSSAGMSSDQQKVAAVSEWRTPTSVEEVRKFIGFASYYLPYIQDITKRLHNLTLKQAQFIWSDECDEVFNTLRPNLFKLQYLLTPSLTELHLSLYCKLMPVLWV